MAAEAGNVAMCNKLIAAGCDIDARCEGQTALMVAAENGRHSVCEALIEAGCSKDARDKVI